jgi:hypothetical protein
VHWGTEILRHFVPQNDRIGGKNDRLGSDALRCGDSFPTGRDKILRMTDKGGCTGHVILRNRRTEGVAFHKWLCSEESAKVGVIVHWGAEILHPL